MTGLERAATAECCVVVLRLKLVITRRPSPFTHLELGSSPCIQHTRTVVARPLALKVALDGVARVDHAVQRDDRLPHQRAGEGAQVLGC